MSMERSVHRPHRRMAAAVVAVIGLAFVLSGCINRTAELSINSDGTFSGTERIEISKQAASLLGITSLDALKSGAASGLQGTADPADECPDISYGETDTAYTIVCKFDSTQRTSGDVTAQRSGETISFAFTQDGSGTNTPDTSGMPTGEVGVLDFTISFPGSVQTITGTSASKVTRIDDNTVQIKGTATEQIDVAVTSSIDSGISLNLAGDESSGLPALIFIVIGVVVLIVLGLVIALLLRARGKSAPVGAAAYPGPAMAGATDPSAMSPHQAFMPTEQASASAHGVAPAAPAGWYPDPEGAPGAPQRYWDGSAWAAPTAPPPPAPPAPPTPPQE